MLGAIAANLGALGASKAPMGLGRRRNNCHAITDVTAYMNGRSFEFVSEMEEPNLPRPSLDVRALELEAGRRALGPLWWVESEVFQLLVSGVVLLNIVIIVHSVVYVEVASTLWLTEQLILCFYVFEMLMRLLHFKSRFFCNVWSESIWNTMDFLLVLYGVFDQWLADSGFRHRSHLMALRAFRILRLLRVVRLVQTLLRGDFHWVDSPAFQWLAGLVIALNAVFMGLETEFVGNPIWWWVNQAFLAFFLFEIGVRVRRSGLFRFFSRGEDLLWNYLDSLIVLTGILDQWVLPWYTLLLHQENSVSGGGIGQMMMLVRILRLMRMLRLLRLVKAVRPLYHLAVGIMKALQSMFWVLVLTMVALYASALLTTNLIGDAMIPDAEEIDPETRALFGTVPDSLFTLFGLMNRQYWQDVSPIFDKLPWAKPVWVVFTILSSWALLSVMTGVVSDNMLEVRQAQEQKDSEAFEEFRERLLRVLTEVFTAADKDGSRSLEKEEYTEILSSPFHVRRLQRVANVPIQDMINMFDWIDVDSSGSISFEDFVHGFDWLNEAVTGKSLLKLESTVRHRCCFLERSVRGVRRRLQGLETIMEAQHEEARTALQEAAKRCRDLAEQRNAEAESQEAETKGLRAEATQIWRMTAAQRSRAEREVAKQQQAAEAALGARRREEAARDAEATRRAKPEPLTIAAIAARLRGGLGSVSPVSRRIVSPSPSGRRQ